MNEKQVWEFVARMEKALQAEQDKVRRWRIRKVIRETTKKLESLKGA